jgi:hypothetical protein
MTVTGLRRWALDGAEGVLRAASACTPEACRSEGPEDWTAPAADEPADDLRTGRVHVVGTTR